MPKRTGDFDDWLLHELTDPEIAASYINTALSEDPDLLPVVLREVARAYTMKKVAKEAGVARESLYTILSASGNPTLNSLSAVLKAVKLKIAVVPDYWEFAAQGKPREYLPEVDQLRMDIDARRPIAGLTGPASVGAAAARSPMLVAMEPQPGVGYLTLKAERDRGGWICELARLPTMSSGLGHVFERESYWQGGVLGPTRIAFAPVGSNEAELGCQMGRGLQQPVP
jgi:probable addiction module antidote protein